MAELFSWTSSPEAWIALLTLTILEVVLGIDNIVFIAILSGKLPKEERPKARRIGLLAAMITRVLLLFSLSLLMKLTAPLFAIYVPGLMSEPLLITGKGLILIGGGVFLLGKSTLEIHERLEGSTHEHKTKVGASFVSVIAQIMVLDMVFSLDSVITAVGLANDLMVMIIAVVIAVIVMMVFVNPISDFVERRPTVKMLALSFLLLIGFTLVGEGFGMHIPKGYVYFAMAFSAFVEALNLRFRSKTEGDPVDLRELPIPGED